MKGTLIDSGTTPHYCPTPGIWRRWRLGVQLGAIWQCYCGQRWAWIVRGLDVEWVRTGARKAGT